MKILRPDLLELNDDALIALANAGFVKKAHKELAEGKAPKLEISEDGALIARYSDQHIATLPAGKSLRDAQCSCPASGLCRHRVTLVLAYQQWAAASPRGNADAAAEMPWSPAQFSPALSELPPATLQKARKLADAGTVLRLNSWQATNPNPSAQLPMCTVRFFSRHNLSHARCDCIESQMCEHIALAVMAFAQAPDNDWTQLNLAVKKTEGKTRLLDQQAAQALDQELDKLALQLWQDGSSQPLSHLEGLFSHTSQLAENLGWRWIIEALAELKQSLIEQANRSSRASPQRELQLLCELMARWQAASYLDQQDNAVRPPSELLGAGVKGEVSLDHLRLIALGAQYSDDEQQEQARLIFADPDTLAVLVIERQWAKEAENNTPLWQRRYLGQSLARLAQSQIVTQAARRFANGALEIANTRRHSNVLPLTPQAWQQLAYPLRHPDATSLNKWLQAADPDFARPRHLLEHLYLLPVSSVLDWGWDGAQQTVHAHLQCGPDKTDLVHLQLKHQRSAPHAVDTLAALLADSENPLTAICGEFSRHDGILQLNPISAANSTCVTSLHGEPAAPCSLTHWKTGGQTSPLQQQLDQLNELLGRWLRQGLRHQRQSAIQQLKRQQMQLTAQGLLQTAQLLSQLSDTLSHADQSTLPCQLLNLFCLSKEYGKL
ncbi:hypothetical protein HA050_01285 [Iodobacter sp. HSC-16F04]|uniref:SWIM-type domain-containing protein n=1 Tax=Iodobacter violaceini TaxID=3044271 RepID=A0ABX0KUS4_9NEIS|nr:SWIM zinc finger family protein [Iodobacter violacea]NHQ84751.1 hypothetical protein [Iodobacter violacea]